MRGGMYVSQSVDIHTYPYIHPYMHLRTLSESYIVNESCPPPVNKSINRSMTPLSRDISHQDKVSFFLSCVLAFFLSLTVRTISTLGPRSSSPLFSFMIFPICSYSNSILIPNPIPFDSRSFLFQFHSTIVIGDRTGAADVEVIVVVVIHG